MDVKASNQITLINTDLEKGVGRNYYTQNQPWVQSKLSTDYEDGHEYGVKFIRPHADCPNGFYMVGGKGGNGALRITEVITDTGYWTISFWVRGSQSSSIYVSIGICDSPVQRISTTSDNTWKKIELTFEVNTYTEEVYNFIEFSDINWAYFYIKDFKVEKGRRATDWVLAPEDMATKDSVSDAAKTATNYLSFSNSGLIVGDMSASTLGKNVLIDSDSVDIRNGNTALATFAADTIELGKNNTRASIELCGNVGRIEAVDSTDEEGGFTDNLRICSDDLSICGGVVSLNASTEFTNNSLSSSDINSASVSARAYDNAHAAANLSASSGPGKCSAALSVDANESDSYGAYISFVANDSNTHTQTIFRPDSWTFNNKVVVNSNLNMAGNSIDDVGVKKISISGVNKLLWSGTLHMSADQTIVLSEAISAQVNGIVLVFSTYNNSTSTKQNSNWNEVYIPKYVLNYYNTAGHVIKLASNSFSQFGFKYLYFTDTTIIGDDVNTKSGTSNGVTYSNTWFVLRYVIGV